MATNTISGVIAGTTITIPLTVNSNAAVAQQALNTLSSLVANGTLSFVNYTGSSTLPGGTTSEFAVIEQGTSTVPLAIFEIGGSTVSAVLDGAALQSLIVGTGFFDPTAATVVSGAAGAVIGNIAAGTDVFFNGGNNGFTELGLSQVGGPTFAGSGTVWLSGNGTFDDSNGSTAINIGVIGAASTGANPFGQAATVMNNGLGTTTINLTTDTTNSVDDGKVIVFSGSSTIATTVNAAGGATSLGAATGGYGFIGIGSGLSFINGNGSNVDMFFGSGTVFGGAGTDIDAENQGLFVGGTHNSSTAGGSFLFGSAVAGTTTLVGGGNNDLLAAVGAKTLMIAGQGNETLYAFATGATVQGIGTGLAGATVIGADTLPTTQTTGSATNMLGEVGGNTFLTGVGLTNITAAQSGGGNTLQEGVAGKNTAAITSFLSGTDAISLTNPAGGKYTPESTGAPTSGQVEVAAGTSGGSVVTFGDGTTWTFNTVVQLTDFH